MANRLPRSVEGGGADDGGFVNDDRIIVCQGTGCPRRKLVCRVARCAGGDGADGRLAVQGVADLGRRQLGFEGHGQTVAKPRYIVAVVVLGQHAVAWMRTDGINLLSSLSAAAEPLRIIGIGSAGVRIPDPLAHGR